MKIKNLLLLLALTFITTVTYAQFQPTSQASNVQITYKTTTGATITWTRGNGSNCIAVIRKLTSTNSAPPSSTTVNYIANATYGNGSSLGNSDNYVVYEGTGTSVFVSGLSPNTAYVAVVYEYNKLTIFTTTTYYYNTSYTATNYEYFYTLDASPTSAAVISSVTPAYTAAAISIIAGAGGDGRLVYLRPSTGSNAYPSDGYTYNASNTYGSGALLGGGYVVANTNVTSVNVTNLLPATLYYAYAHEFNNGTFGTNGTYSYNTRNYYLGTYSSFYTLNYQPTINTLSDLSICQNAGLQTVNLSGISDGSGLETQTTSVTATSSNTGLIPNPTVTYNSPDATGSISFTPINGQSGTATITVTVNDGWFSNNTKSVTFNVVVKAIPASAGAITGTTPICAGSTSQSYTLAALANATGYNWTLPGGWTISNGNNTNAITITTTTNASSGYISVYGTNSNGCGNGIASSKYIQVDAQPATAVAGSDLSNLCTGNAALTATAVTTPNTGSWTQLSGPTNLVIPSGNNVSISGMVTPSSTYSFVWSVSNGGVCPAKKDTLTVNVNTSSVSCSPTADFLVNPSSYACAGAQVQLTDNSVSANTWTWSSNPISGVNFSSTSTQNPTVTFATAGSYTVSLQIHSNATGLNYNTNKVITVKTTPAKPGAISGLTSSCAGNPNQVNYSIAPVSDADSYNWALPSGANLSTNTGTGISVLYGALATDGNISVTATNNCGTSAASTLAINITELPLAAGSISGSTNVCQGQNGVSYTVPPINYATSYVWTDIAGNKTTTAVPNITYNIATNAANGSVWVKGINSCGSGDSSYVNVIVNPLPGSTGVITGNALLTVCPAASAESYYINPAGNATSYNWVISNGGVITYGANSDSIVVDFSSANGSGTIQVNAINACGNGSVSAALNVHFMNLPTVDLCIVTVDTASLHNEIYWVRPQTTEIDSFKVYRKLTALSDTLIGTVAYSSPSYLKDMLVIDNPNTNPYEYTISTIDACGNEGAKSAYHKTMFLTVSNGPGVMNLAWNQYVGQTVNYYRILRDTTGSGNWELLNGLVPPSTNVYVDNAIPVTQPNTRYKVEVDWLTTCDPSRGAINTSRSNIKTSSFTVGLNYNISLSDVSIYPSPAHDIANIELQATWQHAQLSICNELGQLVYHQKTNGDKVVLNTGNFAPGVYILSLQNEKGQISKKLIIE